MAENPYYKRYLQYIVNAGGNATPAQFDDDWEPIGPQLRYDLDAYIKLNTEGKLVLSELGEKELAI